MNGCSHLLLVIGCLGLASTLACGLDPNAPQEPDQASSSLTGSKPTGDTSSANLAEACQELEDTLAACVPSLSGTLQCANYADWPCDVSAYFDCIADAYGSCAGGAFPDLDPLALQDCAPLAMCN